MGWGKGGAPEGDRSGRGKSGELPSEGIVVGEGAMETVKVRGGRRVELVRYSEKAGVM